MTDALTAWHEVDGHRAVDLFAGPGGWDLAALALALEVLGVEWDDAACATRAAAGLRTLQADVSELDPADFGPVDGLIGSPPCPTFSRAGRGAGRHLVDVIVACLRALADGRDTRTEARAEAYTILEPTAWLEHLPEPRGTRKRAQHRRSPVARARRAAVLKRREQAHRDATMSVLVVEPLRWALELRPTWIALEQVPDVLPLWKVVGEVLEGLGYSTWSGVLEAERYGVPQTRERAALIARRDGTPAHPPIATHQRYDPRTPRLDGPELTLEGEVLPWVSMADALSAYGAADLVGFPRRSDGAEAVRCAAFCRSPTLDEPAPTIIGGHDTAKRRWEPADVAHYMSATKGGTRDGLRRSAGEPSRTIDSTAARIERERTAPDGAAGDPLGLKGDDWPDRRPATTVAGDPRVFQPGGHHGNGEQSRFAVRVTEQEAGILQTFPAGYPWQGARGKRYQQIGNAVPPLLALRVLEAVTDRVAAPVDSPPIVDGDGRALDRRQGGLPWIAGRGGAPVRRDDEPAHTLSSSGLASGRDVWVPPGGEAWKSPRDRD